jgi:histone-lysine N-methyltransferase SETMAR
MVQATEKKAQQFGTNVRSMFIWFFFDIVGIVHKEFVPPGQTVNEKFYCYVLRRLRENVWCKCTDKWRNNLWTLHHDNTTVHASLVLRQYLGSTNKRVIPHSPYSPNLAPCDFFFPVPDNEIEFHEALYQCRRGLFRRGWKRIEISIID